MASNFFYQTDGSYNKAPVFNGECYTYWKERMRIFICSNDLDVWETIENGPFVPKQTIEGVSKDKPRDAWTNEEKRKVQLDWRGKNFITAAVGQDEFFRICACQTAKEMWDTLQVTHEGTSDVKRARINTLTYQYELFQMNQGESIQDVQKRFTHIVNHLATLGKTFSNEDLINKVLRCLNRNWQPKVTAIAESRNLGTMTLATLFGKLQEHEMELSRLEENEKGEKKKKSLALVTTSTRAKKHEEYSSSGDSYTSSSSNEDINQLVRKFGKFLKKKEGIRSSFNKGKKDSKKGSDSSTITCYECGKKGHYKTECPQLEKKIEKNEKKSKRFKKKKKAYVAWQDNDLTSSSDSNEDEEINLALKASHEDDEEEEEVYSNELDLLPSYDELQNAFEELHDESLKFIKQNSLNKKIICDLKEKLSLCEKEFDKVSNENKSLKTLHEKSSSNACCKSNTCKISNCDNCAILRKEIDDLKSTLAKFTMGRDNLRLMLGNQKRTFDKAGLGYKPFERRKVLKNCFANPSNFTSPFITCYYCCKKGHKASTCNIRNNAFKNGKKVWIPKGLICDAYPQGPKQVWVPKSYV